MSLGGKVMTKKKFQKLLYHLSKKNCQLSVVYFINKAGHNTVLKTILKFYSRGMGDIIFSFENYLNQYKPPILR